MALDDHEVCLKAALAATLVVFLTLEKRRQAWTLTEWALILEVLKDIVYSIHGDVEEVRERGWRQFPSQAYSVIPPTIGFLQMV